MKHQVLLYILIGISVAASLATAQTTYELREDAAAAHAQADAELNTVYRALMDTLDEKRQDALRQAQRAWIAYRDAAVTSEGMVYEGGSLQPLIELGARTELTVERINRLKGMFIEGYPGDARPEPSQSDAEAKKAQAVAVVKDWLATHMPEYRLKTIKDYWPTHQDPDSLNLSFAMADFNFDQKMDAAFIAIEKHDAPKALRFIILHDVLGDAPGPGYREHYSADHNWNTTLSLNAYTKDTLFCVYDEATNTSRDYTGDLPIGLPYLLVCGAESHCLFALVYDGAEYRTLGLPEFDDEDRCISPTPQDDGTSRIGPEIKGLQLGMDITAAAAIIAGLGLNVPTRDNGAPLFRESSGRKTLTLEQGMITLWRIQADERDQLDEIQLSGAVTNEIFGTRDLNIEEFIQAFINAYGIPRMDVDIREADIVSQALGTDYYHVWEYTNRTQGWQLTITEHKDLTLNRVTPAKELRFD